MDWLSITALIVAIACLVWVFGRAGFSSKIRDNREYRDKIDRFR